MRLRILGAVCASCAATASSSPSAVAQEPSVDTAAPVELPPVAPPPDEPAAVALAPVIPPADMISVAKGQLIEQHIIFARRLAHLHGTPLSVTQRSSRRTVLQRLPLPVLRVSTRRLGRDVRRTRERQFGGAPDVPIPPQLQAIAQCESHGDPRAISAGGTYRGKYQFSFSTWRTVGGTGDPAAASETEQDRRAAMLYRSGGPGHWPVCGR